MKTIKLLFSISFIFIFASSSIGQAMFPNTNYLYLIENTQGVVEKFAYFSSGDTNKMVNNYYVLFTDTIVIHEDKVYYKNSFLHDGKPDSLLYFDFGLKVNDTTQTGLHGSKYVVDSIKSIKLQDSIFYTHIFLRSLENGVERIWIKGLGDSYKGWLRHDRGFATAYVPRLKAICREQSIVLWNNEIRGFDPSKVNPTCDFVSLLKYISVKETSKKSITVFPNPVENILTIETEQPLDFIEITDLTGKKLIQTNEVNINMKHLNSGVYLLNIQTKSGQRFVKKVIKNDF